MAAAAQSGQGAAAMSSESHAPTTDLVSKLPTREGWSEPLVLYNNYWLRSSWADTIIRVHSSFKPRHDDVILASNPKCGTTWMKALAFAITNRSRHAVVGNDGHPLLSRHPQTVVPYIEMPRNWDVVETLPSPRLLATHMPLSLFPDSMVATHGCRIVYVCREPKDVFVSRWHFENKMRRGRGQHIELEAALDMFVEGCSAFGPFWDHCLEYWRESLASPDKVLFLRYEEMMAEPVKHVVRLATFLGVPFSAKEEEDGVPEEVVRLCSFETLSSLPPSQPPGNAAAGTDMSIFFRKGTVEDWKNHMSEEMGKKIDRVVEEKLKGSGLVL